MAVVRGPWERLVSGFVGKMYNTYGGSCGDGQGGGNETCFRDNFMARYDPALPEEPFVKFLTAFLSSPDAELNTHFLSQANQCLREGRKFDLVVDLSDREGLDRISLRMGANSSQLFSTVMSGKYSKNTTEWHTTWCWRGCAAHVELIERVRTRLGADVTAIKALTGIDYGASFDKAVALCTSQDSLCHDEEQYLFRHDEQTWHEADFRISNEKGGDFEFWDNYRNDRQRGGADALQPAEEPNSR
jgi:hypothetical protein